MKKAVIILIVLVLVLIGLGFMYPVSNEISYDEKTEEITIRYRYIFGSDRTVTITETGIKY